MAMVEPIKGLIDEIDGVLNTGTDRTAEQWLSYVRDRLEQIVKTSVADTKEESEEVDARFDHDVNL